MTVTSQFMTDENGNPVLDENGQPIEVSPNGGVGVGPNGAISKTPGPAATPNGVSLSSLAPAATGALVSKILPGQAAVQEAAAASAPTTATTTAAPAAAGLGLPGGVGLGGIAAGAATGYEQFQGVSNLASGKPTSPLQDAAMLTLPGAGLAVLGEKLGFFGNQKSTKEIQADRMQALVDNNTTGYGDYLKATTAAGPGPNEGGRVDNSNPATFVGYDANGKWVNNKFAASRNEADLMPEDVAGQTGPVEVFGNDWFGKYTNEQRTAISKVLLQNKLIQEKQAGIYITDPAAAKNLAAPIISATPATNQQEIPSSVGSKVQPAVARSASLADIQNRNNQELANKQQENEAKQQNKASKVKAALSNLPQQIAPAPRYDINLSPLFKNQYL